MIKIQQCANYLYYLSIIYAAADRHVHVHIPKVASSCTSVHVGVDLHVHVHVTTVLHVHVTADLHVHVTEDLYVHKCITADLRVQCN